MFAVVFFSAIALGAWYGSIQVVNGNYSGEHRTLCPYLLLLLLSVHDTVLLIEQEER
jgi:hypothetical protein